MTSLMIVFDHLRDPIPSNRCAVAISFEAKSIETTAFQFWKANVGAEISKLSAAGVSQPSQFLADLNRVVRGSERPGIALSRNSDQATFQIIAPLSSDPAKSQHDVATVGSQNELIERHSETVQTPASRKRPGAVSVHQPCKITDVLGGPGWVIAT